MNDELNGLKSTATGVADADVTAAATDLHTLIDTLCPDGVEWKTLGECCEILDTKRKPIAKAKRVSGDYPYYGANGIQDYVNGYLLDGTYLLVAEDGSVLTPSGNPVVNWATGKIWVNNHAHILYKSNITQLRYLYYYMQTINISQLIHGNIPKLTGGDLRNIKIPVPPLAVQAKIVQILNKFTELAKELAKEKQARRTQYEYYRDWLLDLAHPEGKQGKVWDLLHTLCPDGVEWKTLGDIASISRGGSLQRKDFRPSGVPCIHYGQIYTDYNLTTDHTISFIDEACAARQKFANKNDLIMTITSENIPDICKCIAWLGQEKVAVSGDAVIIRHNQDPKYLAYYLSSVWFFKQKQSLAYGTKVMHVSAGALSKVRIPVPPLAVQAEIVRILDQFSTLAEDITAGLPAEIAARQTQYEYYRNQLLSFKDVSDRAPGC